MDVQYFHFHSGAGKLMLLRSRTEAESHCENLKLKIDDSEPQKFFFCSSSICTHKSYNLSSPYRDVLCKCRRPMNREVKLTKSLSKEQHVVKGAFVNVNTTFLVTDELQVVPMSTAATLSLFVKHGLADDSSIKEIVFNVGADEILKLLLCTIVTKTPFTEILLKHTETPPLKCLSTLHRKSDSQKEEIFKLSNDIQERNITVKLMVSKSKKMVCYAEAHKDFVNLLFSFLTVPLSYMARNLSGVVPFRGCLHHFYKSVQDLGKQFFISNCHKEILVNPRLPFGFRYRNNLLGMGKASHPPYYSAFCTNITRKHEPFMTTDKSLIPSYYNDSVLLKVIDTATDYAADCNGNDGGIVSGPTTMFMVTDSLIITPLSSSSCVSILKELQVPVNDVEEMVVYVGKIEAMRLLLASFVPVSALTNVFIRNSD